MCYLQPHFSSSFPSLSGAVMILSGALSSTMVPFQAADTEKWPQSAGFFICGYSPDGTNSKESTWNVGDTEDLGSTPGSGRLPRGGNSNPLQYSCLEITRTEEPHRLQAMGHKESDTTEVSEQTFSTVGTGWPCVPFPWRTGLRILLAIFKWELTDNL